MKIQAINNYFYNYQPIKKNLSMKDKYCSIDVNRDFESGLTFGACANAGKLKILFSYGVPSMYGGGLMIDNPRVLKQIKNGVFELPVAQILPRIEQYEESLDDVELKVYKIIKRKALDEPYKTLQEIFQQIAPVYHKRLKKKQLPIIGELIEKSHQLPDSYRYKFKQFIQETNDKIEGKPILVPFNSSDFQYKLKKIQKDLKNDKNPKSAKVLNKMIRECSRLYETTSVKNIETQKKVVNFLELIRKRSVLKDYESLKNLLEISMKQLNNEKIIIPFQRKVFIRDLCNLIENLPDKELRDDMIFTAQKLPTSRESTSAYITKFARESSSKIAYRLFWPFFYSIEHLLPRSKGGKDEMSNYGGATTRENADRKNLDFDLQLKKHPETKKNTQKYINRMIELKNMGIFALHNVPTEYISEFKDTVKFQSKGALVLDTSKA